jgi:homogentisate phytyltransferase / homogentisate geranylgeranyltransferase
MRLFNYLKILYNFSRPHTIIGSFVSITTLALLAHHTPLVHFNGYAYIMLLIAALACNIFITGYNQITDVDIDRINKPYLAIVSGALSLQQANIIVLSSGLLCIIISLIISWQLCVIMLTIMAIGYVYSAPMFRLKKHHLPAALCIVIVRGVIVNLGIGSWLYFYLYEQWQVFPVLYPLTIFIVSFSIAIAWLKDLYDIEGDTLYKIKTFAVLYSIKWAFWLSVSIVIVGYISCILFIKEHNQIKNQGLLIWGHIAQLILFIVHTYTSSYYSKAQIQKFYMRFWVFFFAQYILYAIGAIL